MVETIRDTSAAAEPSLCGLHPSGSSLSPLSSNVRSELMPT